MPTLNIDHTNPADIRNSMELLAKLLPDETMFLVNTQDDLEVAKFIAYFRTFLPKEDLLLHINITKQDQVASFIGYLQTFLPQPLKAQAEIPAELATYDDLVTQDTLVALAEKWPESSPSFIARVKRKGYTPYTGKLWEWAEQDPNVPFRNIIYSGHILHPHYTHRFFKTDRKTDRFWHYVRSCWTLPQTPADWLPPDMR